MRKKITINEDNNTVYVVICKNCTGENAVMALFANRKRAFEDSKYYNEQTNLKTKVIEMDIDLIKY